MTSLFPRPVALLLALTLTTVFWLPTLGGSLPTAVGAPEAGRHTIVVTAATPLVLM